MVREVYLSLMWSFLVHINNRYDGKSKLSIKQLLRILSVKFDKMNPKELDKIEELKIKCWTSDEIR